MTTAVLANPPVPKASSSLSSTVLSDQGAAKAMRHLELHAEPNSATPLMPAHVCHAIIARAHVHHQPMGEAAAKRACAMLLANYPYAKGRDGQEIDRRFYAAQIISVFARFPEWAGIAVVDPVTGLPHREPTFLPSAPELAIALQQEVSRDHVAAVRAQKHLAEGERRAAEPVMTKAERAAMASKLLGLSAKLRGMS